MIAHHFRVCTMQHAMIYLTVICAHVAVASPETDARLTTMNVRAIHVTMLASAPTGQTDIVVPVRLDTQD